MSRLVRHESQPRGGGAQYESKRPDTNVRVAETLRAAPKELMKDVDTAYDVLRSATDVDLARQQLKRFN